MTRSDTKAIEVEVLSHNGTPCDRCGKRMTKIKILEDVVPGMMKGDIGEFCSYCNEEE